MSKGELGYLYNQRLGQGYSKEEASSEVDNFVDSQKKFKILNKEYKKSQTIIRNQEKEIEKLKEKVFDLKQKNKNLKEYKTEKSGKEMFFEDVKKEKKTASGSLVYASRIMRLIEEGKEYNQNEISLLCQAPRIQVKPTLHFLVTAGLLEKINVANQIKFRKKNG